MINLLTYKISIDKIENDEKLSIIDNTYEFLSYREFIRYFEDLDSITLHNLIIGIYFTYGWMPTMLKLKSRDLAGVLHIIQKAKNRNRLEESEISDLIGCFNNSLVGTSKLLHFINPSNYAIWDSRVYRYLTNKKPNHYKLSNIKSYLAFLELCSELTKDERYPKIHNSIVNKIGYEMSYFRSIELIMYLNGK